MYHLTYQTAGDASSEVRTATVGDALILLARLADPLFRYGGSLDLRGSDPDDPAIISITVTSRGPVLPSDWHDHLVTAMIRAHQLPSREEVTGAARWLAEERARGWQPRSTLR